MNVKFDPGTALARPSFVHETRSSVSMLTAVSIRLDDCVHSSSVMPISGQSFTFMVEVVHVFNRLIDLIEPIRDVEIYHEL